MQRHGIATKIDTLLIFEIVCYMIDKLFVEIVSSEMRISIGAHHLKYTLGQFENRDVKRTTTEVIDHNFFVLVFF